MSGVVALVAALQLAASPPLGARLKQATQVGAQVLVRTEHAPLTVDGERYRLVTGRAPMVAVVRVEPRARVRLVAYVVRLGTRNEPEEGATPVVVTVDNERHIFPNRPRLVRERVVSTPGQVVEVASYPVRYPLATVRRDVNVRVALRRPQRGGGVGVRLAVESLSSDELPPLNRLAKRKRRRARKKPPPVVKPDAGPRLAAVDDRLEEELAATAPDAGPADAGVRIAEAPPPPPPAPPRRGRVTVAFRNTMGDVFRLRRIELAIDGVPVDLPKWRGRNLNKGVALYDGDLAVGAHFVDVSLMYVGRGGLLFSYLDEYTFHAGDGRRIEVREDGHIDIDVEAYEGGNFITEMVDRPAVRFHLRGGSP